MALMSLKVRFVRVLLETGEYEILVTSLLDEKRYPTSNSHYENRSCCIKENRVKKMKISDGITI
jgi:hypothetical protein